ncbi:MAG: TonB-dependent receptor, partial [Betaproteobacteria bacterium]|nr:TonB-dependent receptor [Betaproteobacteria bacterium]
MKSIPKTAQRALAIAIAATLPAAYADAPSGAIKNPVIEKVDTIEVVGHYDNGVGSSDAASQGTVNAKLIENRPALRPGEILEFVPGVIVTQHSGGGKANQYFLRGFNLDHGTDFATYVAGMPVNMPTHAHGQGYSDLNFLIPELVERIDYRKGTYFAEEGDFASAGSARIHLLNSLKQSTAELTLGSFDYQRLLVVSSQAIGEGSLLYAVDASHNNGPWRNPDNFRRSNALLRYHHGSDSNGWGLTLMGYDARWNSTDQIPQRAVQLGLLDRFDTIDKSDGGKTSRYSLSFDLKARSADSLIQANAYLIRSRFNLFSNFTYFLDDPVNGDQFEQAERRTVAGLAASQTWFGKLGGSEMTNTIGIQLRNDRLAPVGLYANKERHRLNTVREDRARETAAGIYVENNIQWLEKFRSIAGLRYDHYRFKVDSSISANSGDARDHTTSPKLSLIFGPWA